MNESPKVLKPLDVLKLGIIIREFRKRALVELVKVIPVDFKAKKVIK